MQLAMQRISLVAALVLGALLANTTAAEDSQPSKPAHPLPKWKQRPPPGPASPPRAPRPLPKWKQRPPPPNPLSTSSLPSAPELVPSPSPAPPKHVPVYPPPYPMSVRHSTPPVPSPMQSTDSPSPPDDSTGSQPIPKWKQHRPLPKWKLRPPPSPPSTEAVPDAPRPLPKWKRRPPPSPSLPFFDVPQNPPMAPPSPPVQPPSPPPPPHDADADAVMDIFIQAGGSNTWGDNGLYDNDWVDATECYAPMPGKLKMWSWPNQTWVDAVPDVHSVGRWGGQPSIQTGPDLPFGRSLINLGMSKKVGFIPCAMGGTSMFANWQPSNNDQYPAMVNQTRRAMASIGKKGRLAGIVMMLGEGDAMTIYNTANTYNPSGTVWSSMYGLLLTGMLTYLREELQDLNPQLPIILVKQATKNRERVYPWIQSIRDQQIAMNLSNMAKPDMEGCRIYPINMTLWNGWLGIPLSTGMQAVHLSRWGQCCMGERMAAAWAEAYPGFYDQPPLPTNYLNQTLVHQYETWPLTPLVPPSPPPWPPESPATPPIPPPPSPCPPPPALTYQEMLDQINQQWGRRLITAIQQHWSSAKETVAAWVSPSKLANRKLLY